jgi:arylformamidase
MPASSIRCGNAYYMVTIYKQFNQEQLNYQYNTRLSVPDYKDYFEAWANKSSLTRSKFRNSQNIHYGIHAREYLDIFPAKKSGSKTMVFIHGGYWHLLDKKMFHFLTPFFGEHDITCVFINYPLSPEASISEIVSSCKRAMTWVSENINNYNGDPSEIYVSGHSAGGHLAAMLLTINDLSMLKGMISLSGIFRLEPVMLSYLNEMIGIDAEGAARNSPVLLNRCTHCPVLLVTGKNESEEFRDQSKELFDKWNSQNGPIELLEVPDKNHYSILDTITDKGSPVQSAIFRLMNIRT